MKALSVKQPWTEAIRQGLKPLEIRTWKTDYRGDILICASVLPDPEFDLSGENLILGHALCIVELFDITDFLPEHANAACIDYFPGAFAWHLRNVREIKPFPVKGKLGLFEVCLPDQ